MKKKDRRLDYPPTYTIETEMLADWLAARCSHLHYDDDMYCHRQGSDPLEREVCKGPQCPLVRKNVVSLLRYCRLRKPNVKEIC